VIKNIKISDSPLSIEVDALFVQLNHLYIKVFFHFGKIEFQSIHSTVVFGGGRAIIGSATGWGKVKLGQIESFSTLIWI